MKLVEIHLIGALNLLNTLKHPVKHSLEGSLLQLRCKLIKWIQSKIKYYINSNQILFWWSERIGMGYSWKSLFFQENLTSQKLKHSKNHRIQWLKLSWRILVSRLKWHPKSSYTLFSRSWSEKCFCFCLNIFKMNCRFETFFIRS